MRPIPDGYSEVPAGKTAAIVTHLEMRQPPATKPSLDSRFVLRRHDKPDLDWYRRLFRKIGEEWLWFSRLQMTDDVLRSTIHDPAVDIFALEVDGEEKGILELDRREMPDIELAFFGVTNDLVGKGVGRFLMDHALDLAWSHEPQRVVVHTCTLDHPRALGFYQNSGFVAYKRSIEIADDPRLDGTLRPDAAPHCPLLRPAG